MLLASVVLCGVFSCGLGTQLGSSVAYLSELRSAKEVAHEFEASTARFLDGLTDDLLHVDAALRNVGRGALVQIDTSVHASPAKASQSSTDQQIPEQMPAMVEMLKGMYDTWKEKIGQANKREKEQKRAFDITIQELEQQKQKLKDKGATDTYNRIEKYWTRQRANSHRQYHTALKIMHSGMERFKAMQGAMRSAIAGKKPKGSDLKALGLEAAPEVVFLQRNVRHFSEWIRSSVVSLHAARQLSSSLD